MSEMRNPDLFWSTTQNFRHGGERCDNDIKEKTLSLKCPSLSAGWEVSLQPYTDRLGTRHIWLASTGLNPLRASFECPEPDDGNAVTCAIIDETSSCLLCEPLIWIRQSMN